MQPAAAWYFLYLVGSFFAQPGEKRTYKGEELHGLRKFYFLHLLFRP
jgi:hypothetical protein